MNNLATFFFRLQKINFEQVRWELNLDP